MENKAETCLKEIINKKNRQNHKFGFNHSTKIANTSSAYYFGFRIIQVTTTNLLK